MQQSDLEEGIKYYINDNVANKTYSLSETQSISFDAAAGSNQDRFALSYGTADVLSSTLL